MGLLDKTNPFATPESVRRHAIVGGIIGIVVCLGYILWSRPDVPYWLLIPGAGLLSAAFAALLEWQGEHDIEIYEVMLEVDEEFGIELPKDKELDTVGEMYQLILAVRRQKEESSVNEADTWERLKTLLVKQLRIKPEQVTPEAEFYVDIPM